MAGFNTQLTKKMLMIFLSFLQLIRCMGAEVTHKFNGRRFVRLSLKPDAFDFNVQQNSL
ncbi:hypothetical protein M153_15100016013 [Pseudoloma neurophilia]|uniref:Uncharacterized protein n=1 Tax=Pseudoloma neurophilia TaxID=146866 RepID=A0A0R0M5E0_9MICR|nr:hypothetical protein M153_15100016013 [Pseudoloma neurophilia]